MRNSTLAVFLILSAATLGERGLAASTTSTFAVSEQVVPGNTTSVIATLAGNEPVGTFQFGASEMLDWSAAPRPLIVVSFEADRNSYLVKHVSFDKAGRLLTLDL